MAVALELDTDSFNQCIDDRVFRDEVTNANNEAQARGIGSTPVLVINGENVGSPGDFSQVQQLVEAALDAGGR